MAGSLKMRGKIWHGRVVRKGKTFERSLKTESKSVARDRLEQWVKSLEDEEWGKKPRHSINEAIERFAEEHFPVLRPASAKRYYISMERFIDFYSDMKLDDIGSAQLYQFEQLRRKEGVSTSTIRRDFACLSSIYRSAMAWEWIKYNPVLPYLSNRKIHGLRESEPRTRYLSHAEEVALLKCATDTMKPLIRFAIETGLRREEQFSLTWSNVDLGNRELRIMASIAKSKRERLVPLTDDALALLTDWPHHYRSRYVFNTRSGNRYSKTSPFVWNGLQKAAKRADIQDIKWHDLRRTCGCRLLQDYEMSMPQVSMWLGHSGIMVTERSYAFLEKTHLHAALRKGNLIRLAKY